MAPQGIGFGHS